MSFRLNEHVEFELAQLHKLLSEGHDLINNCKAVPPDTAEKWALGAMLQAFYNGIENIFKRIAGEYDGNLLKDDHWHADLLTAMSRSTERRPAVVSKDLLILLKKYLAFRHIVRNIYTHELRWDSMADLVFQVNTTLDLVDLVI